MTEEWKDGGAYPNRYDRKCVECGIAIPKDGRDYFYRKTPGGDYESMCRACMNKIPASRDEPDDLLIGELIMLREAVERIGNHLATLVAQGAK